MDIHQITIQKMEQNDYRFASRMQWNFINNKRFGVHTSPVNMINYILSPQNQGSFKRFI